MIVSFIHDPKRTISSKGRYHYRGAHLMIKPNIYNYSKTFLFASILLLQIQSAPNPTSSPQKKDSVKSIIDTLAKVDSISIVKNNTVTLNIVTEPSNVAVYLSDSLIGMSPISTNVIPGKYILTFKKKGFYVKKIETVIDSTENQELSVQLQQPGAILIASVPKDSADVTLDGKKMGKTPVFIDKLKPNTYKVSISKQNYKTQDTTVTVKSGVTDTISFILNHSQEYTDSLNQQKAHSEKIDKFKAYAVAGLFGIFAIILIIIESSVN